MLYSFDFGHALHTQKGTAPTFPWKSRLCLARNKYGILNRFLGWYRLYQRRPLKKIVLPLQTSRFVRLSIMGREAYCQE